MGLFDRFRSSAQQSAPDPATMSRSVMDAVMLHGLDVSAFGDLTDPDLAEFLRGGHATASGASVSVEQAMKNTAVFRSVSLVAFSIGMLPLHLFHTGDEREKARKHPLFRVLYRRPNDWQTAFEFRQLMQLGCCCTATPMP
ncbi:phage portal protein [Paracoccus methylarcula]|uniref:Phage portal protein n=1 Tax=Paracoccus methylarcula TaxID=72022 RepID=A0A422QSJ3_9RHOB|nr:phage portal protein [Paracoccus methylarcula]